MAPAIVKFLLLSLLFGIVASQIPRRGDRPKNKATQAPKRTTSAAVDDDDDGTSDQCPEPSGFFADADQCDKYYACSDGHIDERLCPDGMVFNDYDINVEKCDLPLNIDCSKRPKLQTPQPTANCPRKNGYFPAAEKNSCDKFFYCVNGMFNAITCPAGLVFSERTGICTWADQANTEGCSTDDIFQFTCEKVNITVASSHPRYADPEDCQYFYVCINGETPRRNGCKLGQVFDDKSKTCDWARNVPECADFYKDRLTDAELEELENPKTTPKPKKTGAPVPQRRRPSRPPPKKVASEEEDE